MNFGSNESTHAAVLNNIGCKFLEHGAFREAFETFGDAFDTYRESFLRGNGSKSQIRLEAAATRLRKVNLLRSSIVRVLCVGEDDFVDLVTGASFGKFMMYGFRLAVSQPGLRDTDIDSAIVLYNFALSHVFLLKYGFRERKAFKDASRLMRMALGALAREMKLRFSRGQAADSPQFRDISAISKVMATNYSYIIAKRGRYSEAKQSYDDMIDNLEQHPQHKERLEYTAAAA